ncbi:MAG: ABC transporter ATP-binding protein [Flaviflexus sp.]|uniref:ABC transporter ATP-binding protein n=1 Tax=Flaviflexus sp. TaxID=1969482 RepID=UPI00352F19B4
MSTLDVRDLVCGYDKTPIIGPLSFAIPSGEITTLIGPNGIGKTTVFKTVLGLLKPMGGEVEIEGKPINRFAPKDFARTIAYVPQNHVPPFPFTVRDVVVMGRNPHLNELVSPKESDYAIAEEQLELLGVTDLVGRDYTELSGGERQLVMIARALTQQAPILMMDEPTAHLDYGNELLVLEQITKLRDLGYTIIMITHNHMHALMWSDTVVAMGRDFFAVGPPGEVLDGNTLTQLY